MVRLDRAAAEPLHQQLYRQIRDELASGSFNNNSSRLPSSRALAADFGSEVHISQEQLGVFVGAARESVNRQLQLWRRDGILDLQRGRILLQNMTKLAAVARNE